jgi:16S rRNA (uracil1498-N3)-methyltransferase
VASRFYVPPEQINDKRFILLGSEARHAAVVLRKKPGDSIDLFDGEDLSYQGRIDSVTPERVEGLILNERRAATPLVQLVLCQGLLKGPKWDWLVEKSCEIGVTTLVPLLTARTVVKPAKGEVRNRWKRIALAASKQCGRHDMMGVAPPQKLLDALLGVPKDALILIPWEKEMEVSVRQAVAGARRQPSPSHVYLFIGPEGGWEAQEVVLAVRHGAIAVRLGPTLLRSETAGLVSAALVLSELGIYS